MSVYVVAVGMVAAFGASQAAQYPLDAKTIQPQPSGVISAGVSDFVKTLLDASTIPGVSMGVVRLASDNQPIVDLDAWGRRTEESDGNDLAPDALFALASCSKAFLVTSIGLLMEDYYYGRNETSLPSSVRVFDWDTKMKDLLPQGWAIIDMWADPKTNLRDAFGHVTGLPRHDYSYRPGDMAEDVVRRQRHLPPAYELREQWSYNNQMFMVGARIIQKYSNTSYDAFVASRIFGRLNMTYSTYSPSKAAQTGLLTQTWTRGVRRIPYWFSDEVNDLFAGPGGAISNAEDMTKWLATLLNAGVDPRTNTTIIPASIFANMTTARAIERGTPSPDVSITGYGMGWFRFAYKGHDVVWHFGAIPGFSLLVAFLQEDNLGVVILANMDEKANETMSILFRVVDEALGLPRTHEAELEILYVPLAFPAVVAFISSATSEQVQQPVLQVHAEAATPPEPLSLGLEAFTGEYINIAYGNISLCAPNSTSSYCISILEDFAPVEAATGDPLPEARLYAAWPRVWSSHIRLRHNSANAFGLVLTALFPHGYGLNKTAFEFYDSVVSIGRVEFLVEDEQVRGFALITQEDAATARAERTHGTIKDIGDAWFESAVSTAWVALELYMHLLECVGQDGGLAESRWTDARRWSFNILMFCSKRM
ncbi:beta-lactamase/transpeptidase-like protein [Trametes cingulata]|nr:beta-lactamase/transpeptidase-like protein [Trametes cingulata]